MAITNGYVTLTELKSRIGDRADRTTDETALEHVIEAASRHVDRVCNRRFYLDDAVSARLFEGGHQVLFVDDIGSLTGLVVKTDDDLDGDGDTTITATDYQAQPPRALVEGRPVTMLRHATCWPVVRCGWATIEVTAKWGWPEVPVDIKEATLILANKLWTQRWSPGVVIGSSIDGMPEVLSGDDRKMFWTLVSPFRQIAIA